MKKLSKKITKRIIAGSLALALIFTSTGLSSLTWADTDADYTVTLQEAANGTVYFADNYVEAPADELESEDVSANDEELTEDVSSSDITSNDATTEEEVQDETAEDVNAEGEQPEASDISETETTEDDVNAEKENSDAETPADETGNEDAGEPAEESAPADTKSEGVNPVEEVTILPDGVPKASLQVERITERTYKKGDKVEIKVIPDKGFAVEEVRVINAKNGKELISNISGATEYTFDMPGKDVVISASFRQVEVDEIVIDNKKVILIIDDADDDEDLLDSDEISKTRIRQSLNDIVNESYIRENYNSNLMKFDKIEIVDNMAILSTMFSSDGISNDASLDLFYEAERPDITDEELFELFRSFTGSTRTDVALYNIDDESKYYVAKITTVDNGANVLDVDFAMDNLNGEVIDGWFDKETGLAYIPKTALSNGHVQAQLLYSVYNPVDVVEVSYVVNDEVHIQTAENDLYADETVVQFDGSVDLENSTICVNGAIMPEEGYEVNDNILTVNVAPSNISTISVVTDDLLNYQIEETIEEDEADEANETLSIFDWLKPLRVNAVTVPIVSDSVNIQGVTYNISNAYTVMIAADFDALFANTPEGIFTGYCSYGTYGDLPVYNMPIRNGEDSEVPFYIKGTNTAITPEVYRNTPIYELLMAPPYASFLTLICNHIASPINGLVDDDTSYYDNSGRQVAQATSLFYKYANGKLYLFTVRAHGQTGVIIFTSTGGAIPPSPSVPGVSISYDLKTVEATANISFAAKMSKTASVTNELLNEGKFKVTEKFYNDSIAGFQTVSCEVTANKDDKFVVRVPQSANDCVGRLSTNYYNGVVAAKGEYSGSFKAYYPEFSVSVNFDETGKLPTGGSNTSTSSSSSNRIEPQKLVGTFTGTYNSVRQQVISAYEAIEWNLAEYKGLDIGGEIDKAWAQVKASSNYVFENENEANSSANARAELFKQIKSDFTFEELDNFTRKASSEDQNGLALEELSLPMRGMRKDISANDVEATLGYASDYAGWQDTDVTNLSVQNSGILTQGQSRQLETMINQPWRNQVFINKTDLETNNQILHDTDFVIYENMSGLDSDIIWGKPDENYEVIRVTEEIATLMGWGEETIGMYTVHRLQAEDDYTETTFTNYLEYGTLYYTTMNRGLFKIVEVKAPSFGNTGYIGNLAVREYTKVERDSRARAILGGRTDKTYPIPQAIANDIAEVVSEHIIQLCEDTNQYETFMLVDSGVSTQDELGNGIYSGEYYEEGTYEGYDDDSHTYVGATLGRNKKSLYYTGKYTTTKLNYNSFVSGDAGSFVSNVEDKNTTDLANALNNRSGYNKTDFVSVVRPELGREYAFINERVKGFIRLTKFDIDAERYVEGHIGADTRLGQNDYRDGTAHADTKLDGAIYSLYVDNSDAEYNEAQIANGGIMHPDGRSEDTAGHADSSRFYNQNGYAVMREQQVFVDTDADGFADTWQVRDVKLENGAKVASAVIKDGELEFDGLYPGNYYIVEEVRSIETVAGIDVNGDSYTDKNYLSFAPGYLVETKQTGSSSYEVVKHYYQVRYVDDTNYVIKDTQVVSSDTAIKGMVSIVKTTSDETLGSGNNTTKREEGAGFTVYLISDLSKIENGDIEPMWSVQRGNELVESAELVPYLDTTGQFLGYKLASPENYNIQGDLRYTNIFIYVPGRGYYQRQAILDAYVNRVYSNERPKWGQFANESQAIARVYEKDLATINLINADYKYVPNSAGPDGSDSPNWGKAGMGNGYEQAATVVNKYRYSNNSRTSVQTKNEYVLSELFTNVRGEIKIPQLAWGAYIVVNTTVPENKEAADPVFVTVSDLTDDNSITTKSASYDLPIEIYNSPSRYRVRIVKRDAQTGQNVLASGIKFRIYDYNKQNYLRLAVSGTAGTLTGTCVFETDESGFVNYNSLAILEPGRYRIEEIEGPNGFWNAYWDYGNNSANNNVFTDKLGYTHYVVNSVNNEELTINNLGGVNTSDMSNANSSNMRSANFGAVDFTVTTAGNWVSSAIVDDDNTTNNNMSVLYMGASYPNEETLGMLTIMKTGEVLVGYDDVNSIKFSDQEASVSGTKDERSYKTYENSNSNASAFDIGVDRDSTQNGAGNAISSTNEEKSFAMDDRRYDFVYEERPIANAAFQIVAAENIYTQDKQRNSDGSYTTWFKAGDVVATVYTARDGEVMDVVPNYNLNGETGKFESVSAKTGKTYEQIYTNEEFATTGRIENKWTADRMSALDKAVFGVPSFTDEYIYPNSYINENGERQTVVRVIKDGTLGQVSVLLPLGKYIVKEIEAPYGFVLPEHADLEASKTTRQLEVEFTWKDQIKEVVFNTNTNSTNDTQSKIDSFVERDLGWWTGNDGINHALDNLENIGVLVEQSLRSFTVSNPGMPGTFTDDYLGDAEVQFYADKNGLVSFYDERIKPSAKEDVETDKLSVGIYKVDVDSEAGLSGAKFGLYTKDDIYSVDGELLVPANTRLAVATTDEAGFAEFEVDIPYKSIHYGVANDDEVYVSDSKTLSVDGNTVLNSGAYYIKELVAPDGYYLNDEIIDVSFEPSTGVDHDEVLYYTVNATQKNAITEMFVSKRDIFTEKSIEGAELAIYELLGPDDGAVVYNRRNEIDWTKCHIDTTPVWTQTTEEDIDNAITGLKLSNLNIPRLSNDELREHVYVLREVNAPAGYITANDVIFEIIQKSETVDGQLVFDQNCEVYILDDVSKPYRAGTIKAQNYYTDHEGTDEYNFNHDAVVYTNDKANAKTTVDDGFINDVQDTVDVNTIAKWLVIDKVLYIEVSENATIDSIKHGLDARKLHDAIVCAPSDILSDVASQLPVYEEIEEVCILQNGVTAQDDIRAQLYYQLCVSDGIGADNRFKFGADMIRFGLNSEDVKLLNVVVSWNNQGTFETFKDIFHTCEWKSASESYEEWQENKTMTVLADQFDVKPADALGRTVVMEDTRSQLIVCKSDITNGTEVVGASLEIRDGAGNVIDRWISEETDHYIDNITPGDYVLIETLAPTADGYVESASVNFTVEDSNAIKTVTMPDNYTRVKITKTDIVTGERVAGAVLEIISLNDDAITWNGQTFEKNDVVYTWTSSADADEYITKLPVGDYKLVETLAPTANGYTTSNEIEFQVSDEDVVTKVDMKDDFTVVEISKTDMVTGEEVADAKLQLYYNEVTKELVKEGYYDEFNEYIPPVYNETVERKLIASWITNGAITVEDGYDFVVGQNISIGKIVFKYLPVGNYELVEELPADGYTTANAVTFEVVDKLYHYEDNDESILRSGSGAVLQNNNEIIKVEMEDDFTVAVVSKIDGISNEEIEGAELEIYAVEVDENGEVVYETVLDEYGIELTKVVRLDANANIDGINPIESWISGSDGTDANGNLLPHTITKLPIGKYVLVEKSAPDGYTIAGEMVFEITDDYYHEVSASGDISYTDKVVELTMVDERTLLVAKMLHTIDGGDKYVVGAKLAIYDYTPEGIDYDTATPVVTWDTITKPHGIDLSMLTIGKYYCLHEIEAPDGYFLAADIVFYLAENPGSTLPKIMVEKGLDNEFYELTDKVLTMYDAATTVQVEKIDQADNNVANAKLGIYKVNTILGIDVVDWDNPVTTFTTTNADTYIYALPVGKYVLHEIEVPTTSRGVYELAEDIKFEITTETRDEIILLKMVDKFTPNPDVNQPDTPVTPDTPSVIVIEKVQTGDTNNYVAFILAGISFAVAAVFGVILWKKKDEKEVEVNDTDTDDVE